MYTMTIYYYPGQVIQNWELTMSTDEAAPEFGMGCWIKDEDEVVKQNPNRFFAIDLIQSKPFPKDLIELLSNTKEMIACDEQTPAGSLGSAVFEAFSDVNLFPKIINVTLPEKYFFDNIGRDGIYKTNGLTAENIIKQSERF